MPQRTRPCPGDRAAAAMGGQGRQTPPAGGIAGAGGGCQAPQAPGSILGCHLQQRCRFPSPHSSAPLGPEQAPRDEAATTKPCNWEQGPAGGGISLQPAGPASVLGNGAPGDWEGGLELPRGPGRGLRAAGGLQPLALSLPTGLPFPKPCPRLPFPGGTGCVPPKASLQPSGIGAPQNVLLPRRAQQHPAPRGDVLGRFVPPASPARRDEADPGWWKSPDSGEDNSRQGERGKKKSPLQFSAGFCLT